MALTLQSAIDLAALVLNDDDLTRYPQADRLKACNHALLAVYAKRPDILIGSYSDTTKIPNGERIATDTFPFDAKFLQPVSDLSGALIQTKDEEANDASRVAALMNRALSFTAG